MLFRPVAAGLLIVTSLVCANIARAEVMIVLSINLTGLDSGARFVQPYCSGFGAERRTVAIAGGVLPFQPVTGGRFVQTVHIPLRRSEAAGGPVTEYSCGVDVWGTRRDGVAYTFSIPASAAFSRASQTQRLSRAAWGMLGSSWSWPGDEPETHRGVVAPIAKGSSPEYFSGGVFLPDQVRALAEVEAAPASAECPCGCGAGGGDGAACAPAKLRAFLDRLPKFEVTPPGEARSAPPPSPPAPPPAGRSPAAITSESRRLGLESAQTTKAAESQPGVRAAGAGTPIVVEAPAIVFRGTGNFVQYTP
jgi:hypothetical protein